MDRLEKFDLVVFRRDPLREVVTRNGKRVRIVCTDGPCEEYPIYGFVEGDEDIKSWDSEGCFVEPNKESKYDLFLCDNVDVGLSVFESRVLAMLQYASTCGKSLTQETLVTDAKSFSKELLEVAGKEFSSKFEAFYNDGYREGKEEAVKEYEHDLELAFKTQDEVVYKRGYHDGKAEAKREILNLSEDELLYLNSAYKQYDDDNFSEHLSYNIVKEKIKSEIRDIMRDFI